MMDAAYISQAFANARAEGRREGEMMLAHLRMAQKRWDMTQQSFSSGVPMRCLASVNSPAEETISRDVREAKAGNKPCTPVETTTSARSAVRTTIDSARYLSLGDLLGIAQITPGELTQCFQLLAFRERGMLNVIDGVDVVLLASLPELVAELAVSERSGAAARLLTWVAENCAAGCGGPEILALEDTAKTAAPARTNPAGWYAQWEERNGR